MQEVAETHYLKKLYSTVGPLSAPEKCKKLSKGLDCLRSDYYWKHRSSCLQ